MSLLCLWPAGCGANSTAVTQRTPGTLVSKLPPMVVVTVAKAMLAGDSQPHMQRGHLTGEQRRETGHPTTVP